MNRPVVPKGPAIPKGPALPKGPAIPKGPATNAVLPVCWELLSCVFTNGIPSHILKNHTVWLQWRITAGWSPAPPAAEWPAQAAQDAHVLAFANLTLNKFNKHVAARGEVPRV